jgi:hypothetical protein
MSRHDVLSRSADKAPDRQGAATEHPPLAVTDAATPPAGMHRPIERLETSWRDI